MLTAKDDAYILKSDGSRCGPYKAKFAGDTVIVIDKMADIDDGDTVIRVLQTVRKNIRKFIRLIFTTLALADLVHTSNSKLVPKRFTQLSLHSKSTFTEEMSRLEIITVRRLPIASKL